MFEEILFKKIEVWVLLLILVAGSIVMVFFGWGVRHYQLGNEKLGMLGEMAYEIASIPTNARIFLTKTLSGRADLAVEEQRFDGQSGFEFNYEPGTRPDLGYMLVNRFDGDLQMSVSELVDLNKQQTVHQWRFDVNPLWEKSDFHSKIKNMPIDEPTDRFRNGHSYLFNDGTIIAKDVSPLVLADLCSNLTMVLDDDLYHHSIEMDHENNLWVAKYIEPKTTNLGSEKFREDVIVKITPEGTILFQKSIISLLIDHGLGYLLYGLAETNDDPTHLNDVQPVLEDGPYWKTGDVFISLRHLSMLLLYRPSTDQLIWHKSGPWVHQHDVNILDDHRISVFNNNAKLFGVDDQFVDGSNNEMIFDFSTGEVSSPYKTAFESLDIRTKWEGRGEIQKSGELFVEETENGRLLQFNQQGELTWSLVNRGSDNQVYYVNWSRPISRELGDRVSKLAKEQNCDK